MPQLNVVRILWAALTFSSLAFIAVLIGVRPEPHEPLSPLFPPLFGVMALGTIGASFFLPSSFYTRALHAARAEVTEVADTKSSDVIPYRDAPRRRVFANPNAARRTAIMIFQTPFIIGMALVESVVLYGFVLGMLGYPLAFAAPFFVVSWVLYALRFPTKHAVFGRFAEAKGAAFPD